MKIINGFIIVSALTMLLTSCGGKKNNDPNYIKVGVASGPEYVIAEAAKK